MEGVGKWQGGEGWPSLSHAAPSSPASLGTLSGGALRPFFLLLPHAVHLRAERREVGGVTAPLGPRGETGHPTPRPQSHLLTPVPSPAPALFTALADDGAHQIVALEENHLGGAAEWSGGKLRRRRAKAMLGGEEGRQQRLRPGQPPAALAGRLEEEGIPPCTAPRPLEWGPNA